MSRRRLVALALAACLPGLPCCAGARSTISSPEGDTPFLVGPVRAIGAMPDPPRAEAPEGEPITVRTKGSEGAMIAMFGPRWGSTSTSSEHMNRLRLHPGAPAQIRHHGCYSMRIFAILVFHVEVWCTVEADIAPSPGQTTGE